MTSLFQVFALLTLCWRVSADTAADYVAPDGSSFRKDYKFYPIANGWLKYHIMPATWLSARHTCVLEGARLASPLYEGLYETIRSIIKEAGSCSVYTGIHSMSTQEDYLSQEGVHLMNIPLQWAESEPDNLNNRERCIALQEPGLAADVNCTSQHPFICYREKVGRMAMTECGTYDTEYKKFGKTGSCYKLHVERVTWYVAHTVCIAEGGHLVIIDSDEEHEELQRKYNFKGTFHGLYKWIDGWRTINDKKLEDTWKIWRSGEPNNKGGDEFCSTFAKDMNDYPCNYEAEFLL